MNLDPGEVLSRAWQVVSKHTMLWVIGIVFGFAVSIMFSPVLFPILLQNSQIDLRSGLLFMAVYIGVSLLFKVASHPIFVLAQPSVPSGILNVTEHGQSISLTYLRFTGSLKLQPLLQEATL